MTLVKFMMTIFFIVIMFLLYCIFQLTNRVDTLQDELLLQKEINKDFLLFQEEINEKLQVSAETLQQVLQQQRQIIAEDIEQRVLYKIRNNQEEIKVLEQRQRQLLNKISHVKP